MEIDNRTPIMDALREALPGITLTGDAGTPMRVTAYRDGRYCALLLTEDVLAWVPAEIARCYGPVLADELKGAN